ncbi:hypothetical protein Mapa_003135 [Marchantia paleacea]|nr:hypothetical protein Mapa_003135 [Marchantia paleacea]
MPPRSVSYAETQSEAVVSTQRDLRFVDFIAPNFQRSGSPHNEPGGRRYIVIFDCYDGGSPNLTYLEYDGNEQALARLNWIALNNSDEDYDVKVLNLDSPLPEAVVDDLMVLTDEELRTALTAHVSPPKADGWVDCEKWHVLELLHSKLNGQVAMLPQHPPVSFPPEWENYACHLFSFFLKDYTRPWQ